MASNKFENHIKNQLEDRRIKPSSEAWEKLSEELGDSSESKKKGYFWYGIAASVIGLLLISFFFVNSLNSGSDIPIQIVENPTEVIKIIKSNQKVQDSAKPVEQIDLVEVAEDQKSKFEKREAKRIVIADLNSAVTTIEKVTASKDEAILNKKSEDIIDLKVLEIVAQVDALENINEVVTDAEVDSLLRKAQQEILTEKLFKSDHSVDAMALLSEVEEELDQSFRDQIFQSLKSGFLKVRTAVADRNN